MMKNFKFFFLILLAASVIVGCSDGDPGPQGEPGDKGEQGDPGPERDGTYMKLGFYEGTVTGTRTDGTAFSKPFKYEYTDESVQAFYEEDGVKYFYASRAKDGSTEGYLDISLLEWNNEIMLNEENNISFRFYDEFDAEKLFSLYATPYLYDIEPYVKELSTEQNQTYRFTQYSNGQTPYDHTYYPDGDQYVYAIYSYLNGKSYYSYYHETTGALVAVRDLSEEVYINEGPVFDLYNQLEFRESESLGMLVFFDAETGAGLYEEIPFIPADDVAITNYNHDSSSGVLSFDFEIRVDGHNNTYGRRNSTGHELTIKGKFNSGGKVYKNVVGREKS